MTQNVASFVTYDDENINPAMRIAPLDELDT